MNLIHTDLKLENILFVNSEWNYHRHAKYGRSRVVKQTDIVVIDLGSATYESVSGHSLRDSRRMIFRLFFVRWKGTTGCTANSRRGYHGARVSDEMALRRIDML